MFLKVTLWYKIVTTLKIFVITQIKIRSVQQKSDKKKGSEN